MYITILILTIIVAALLMAVILMQSSKGGGLSAMGTGTGSDTMLSSRQAATVLHKLTIYLVASFLFLCLLATVISGRRVVGPQLVTTDVLNAQTATETVSTFSTNIPVLPESGEATGTEGE